MWLTLQLPPWAFYGNHPGLSHGAKLSVTLYIHTRSYRLFVEIMGAISHATTFKCAKWIGVTYKAFRTAVR